MNFSRSWSFVLALVCLVVIPFSSPTLLHADTYQVYNLGTDEAVFFFGMDDSGHVVLDRPLVNGCAGNLTGPYVTCYYTYDNGIYTGVSTDAPTIVNDLGLPCTPSLPAGEILRSAVCNNGRTVWTGYLSTAVSHPNLYPSISSVTALGDGSGIFLYMNALGDIVWNDPVHEYWYEAVNLDTLPTPEPSSLVLLSTGLIGGFGAVRRRLRD